MVESLRLEKTSEAIRSNAFRVCASTAARVWAREKWQVWGVCGNLCQGRVDVLQQLGWNLGGTHSCCLVQRWNCSQGITVLRAGGTGF